MPPGSGSRARAAPVVDPLIAEAPHLDVHHARQLAAEKLDVDARAAVDVRRYSLVSSSAFTGDGRDRAVGGVECPRGCARAWRSRSSGANRWSRRRRWDEERPRQDGHALGLRGGGYRIAKTDAPAGRSTGRNRARSGHVEPDSVVFERIQASRRAAACRALARRQCAPRGRTRIAKQAHQRLLEQPSKWKSDASFAAASVRPSRAARRHTPVESGRQDLGERAEIHHPLRGAR